MMNKLVDAFMDTIDEAEMFKPLDPDLEYVDVTHYELEMAHRVRLLNERLNQIEENQRQMAVNNLTMIERMKALQDQLVDLLANQSTADAKPAIILPDRFN